jgi:eukaryotic-like serine/threonine-protein kinase
MDNTHLDPMRAAPLSPPGDRAPGNHPGTGSPPRPPASPPNGSPVPDAHELRSLGEYRILRRLGEGGMGAVYLGYDGRHDRQVALKVLNDNLASNQNYIDRFYREAKSGALLNHPNIVRTYSAGQDRQSGVHYLVLEYVDGPSAHALLARAGRLPVGDAVHIALDIARALEHAHSRNIVHRDIKPDNILLTRSGVAKLGDLGLAKRTDEASHLTAARQGFGTTAYMPYEQAINAKYADGRSDIYALGATLYHLLTGQVPFPGENHLEVVEKKNHGHYRPAGAVNPAVGPALDAILGQMLARHPRDRYQTASEVIIDLERSRLAVPVPTFADPDLAKKDPWVQACMTSGEPTRLDPEVTPLPGRVTNGRTPADEDEWIVHYRNRAGRPFASRLTTEHIIERLQEGTLPPAAEARRPSDEKLRPLSAFAEFRPFLEAAQDAQAEPTRPPSPAAEPTGGWWTTFVVLLASAAALAGGLLLLVHWLFPA